MDRPSRPVLWLNLGAGNMKNSIYHSSEEWHQKNGRHQKNAEWMLRSNRVLRIFMRARDEQISRDIFDKGKPMPLFGPAFVNSASIPVCFQQLVFHYGRWDFRARGVYRTDAMCSRSVQPRVAFLAMLCQAVWHRGAMSIVNSAECEQAYESDACSHSRYCANSRFIHCCPPLSFPQAC
jgi:hypothetical protein